MSKDIITGLSFSGSALEWTAVQRVKGSLEKAGSGEAVLDEGVVSGDCSGIRGDVTASVSSGQVLMRVVDLPEVEEDELSSMVELQMDKYSPFPIENMVVSYEIIDKTDAGCRVLAAAAKTEVIEQVGEKLAGAGIKSHRIDIDIMGWLRLLKDEGRIEGEGRQVIIVVSESPSIVVLQDAVPIALHSMTLDDSMSRTDMLMEIAGEAGYTLMSLELESAASSSLSMVVYSDEEVPADFLEALKEECGCDAGAESLDKLPALSEGIARRAADDGAGLMDLTPVSWRLAESSRQSKKNMISAVASLAGLWLLCAAGFFGYMFYQERVLADLVEEQGRLSGPAGEVRDMASRIRIIQRYMDRSDSALECLLDVSQRLPQNGIELNLFSYKKGESLTVAGESTARNIVLTFQDNLNKSKIFAKVVPGDIKIIRGKHRFSLVLQFPEDEQ